MHKLSVNSIQPVLQLNLATFFFCDLQDVNSPNCFQLNFISPPSLLAIPFPSVFSVSLVLENNPTITNTNSPSSAPKFTLAVRPSSAVKGAWGGQTCSEIYSMLNVFCTQTWNYLSVWVETGAKQYYSNHLGWCQKAVSCLFSLPSFWLASERLSKYCPGEDSKHCFGFVTMTPYRQHVCVRMSV